MLLKCCTQYASKFGKLSSGHRTGKGQSSCQSQRKAMPENAQTTAQLQLSHMPAKYSQNSWSQASTVHEPWTSRCLSTNCQRPLDHHKREVQKNIYFCFIDYNKAFDCVDHNKLWEILKEMRIPDHLTCLLRNLHAGQEATIRTTHETTDWFQIGRGVCQSVYCHLAY